MTLRIDLDSCISRGLIIWHDLLSQKLNIYTAIYGIKYMLQNSNDFGHNNIPFCFKEVFVYVLIEEKRGGRT